MFRLKIVSLILVLALAMSGSLANAAGKQTAHEGLTIAPAISYQAVSPGSSITKTIALSNTTTSNILVDLAVKQFSVKNYSYQYVFASPVHDWIKLSQTELSLAPTQVINVNYTISVPAGSAPGGNYFTLIASTKFITGSISSIGQAASLLYITVAGKLYYSSNIISSTLQHFSFGSNINYSFTIRPSGNVYSYVYTYAHLGKITTSPVAHIVYPNAIRKISGVIGHPVLPGIYKISYGYRSSSNVTTLKSSWVVYLPPWVVAVVIIVLLVLLQLKFRSSRSKQRR